MFRPEDFPRDSPHQQNERVWFAFGQQLAGNLSRDFRFDYSKSITLHRDGSAEVLCRPPHDLVQPVLRRVAFIALVPERADFQMGRGIGNLCIAIGFVRAKASASGRGTIADILEPSRKAGTARKWGREIAILGACLESDIARSRISDRRSTSHPPSFSSGTSSSDLDSREHGRCGYRRNRSPGPAPAIRCSD